MNDWYEWAVIVFITLGIGWVVWKGGAANPESTGAIARKVSHLDTSVVKLGGRVGQVEKDLDELSKNAATTADIATVRAELAGLKDSADRTYRSVDRIERMLLEKGLNGK